jgi:hypothetical protein
MTRPNLDAPAAETGFKNTQAQIDALMREAYGCTLEEFSNKLFKAGFDHGKQAGRRIAKGKPAVPKRVGRPSLVNPELLAFMLHEVRNRKGDTRELMVRFMETMRAGEQKFLQPYISGPLAKLPAPKPMKIPTPEQFDRWLARRLRPA